MINTSLYNPHIPHICYILETKCNTPQLHFYIPQDLADRIKQQAQAAQKSVSSFLTELAQREWRRNGLKVFFEDVVGGWQGELLERPPQGDNDLTLITANQKEFGQVPGLFMENWES